MIKKFLVLLLALCFCLGVLTACSSGDQSETNNTETSAETTEIQQGENQEKYDVMTGEELSEKYNLNSDEILIVKDQQQNFNGNASETIKITDSSDIEKIISSVNFSEWESTGSWYDGIYEWTMVFNGNIGMRFGSDFAYASIGTMEKEDDGTYIYVDPQNSRYDYDLPQEFIQTLNDIMEKYSK